MNKEKQALLLQTLQEVADILAEVREIGRRSGILADIILPTETATAHIAPQHHTEHPSWDMTSGKIPDPGDPAVRSGQGRQSDPAGQTPVAHNADTEHPDPTSPTAGAFGSPALYHFRSSRLLADELG